MRCDLSLLPKHSYALLFQRSIESPGALVLVVGYSAQAETNTHTHTHKDHEWFWGLALFGMIFF